MRTAQRIVASVLLASLVPAAPFIFIGFVAQSPWSLFFVVMAWLIGLAHIVVLGLPAFWLLTREQLANSWSLLAAGFALGFLPTAIYSSLQSGSIGSSTGGSIVMGVAGALTARAFLGAWRWLSPNYALKRTCVG